MTVFLIPTPTGEQPFADQRTTLDGREYVLTFTWNSRESRWYLRISDESGDDIAGAVKILPNMPLFRRVRDERIPPGMLVALADDDLPPGLEDLGSRVKLYYYDTSETSNTSPIEDRPYTPYFPRAFYVMDGAFMTIGGSRLYIRLSDA